MIFSTIFMFTALIFTDASAEEQKAAAEVCNDLLEVSLIPTDLATRKIKPKDTLVAKDIKSKNLVPIKIVIWFMNPHAAFLIPTMPENVKLIFMHMVNNVSGLPTQDGKTFVLLKPELTRLVGKDDEEGGDKEGGDKEGGDKEGGDKEEEGGEEEPAAGGEMKPNQRRRPNRGAGLI